MCQVERQFCPGIVESPETWWKTRGGLALVRHTWQHVQSGLGGGKVDAGGQAGRHRGGGQGENGAVRGAVRKACGWGSSLVREGAGLGLCVPEHGKPPAEGGEPLEHWLVAV